MEISQVTRKLNRANLELLKQHENAPDQEMQILDLWRHHNSLTLGIRCIVQLTSCAWPAPPFVRMDSTYLI